MKRTPLVIGILIALSAPALHAQSTGGSVVVGQPSATSAGQAVTSTPVTSNAKSAGMTRPIYISGKVVLDDGAPLPQNVTIERICSGISRTVAYTDTKGAFSFQWGQNSTVMAEASDSGFGVKNSAPTGGFGNAQSAGGASALASDPYANAFNNCELRASLGGYKSDLVNLFTRTSMESSDIGMIVLHHIAGVEGRSISTSSLQAPKDAKKSYDRGLQSLLKNKLDDAAKDFEKAVAAYPKYADAWLSLGKIRLQQNDNEQARIAMLKAIDADPKLVPPYLQLGLVSAQQQKWEESTQYLDRAMKLDPVDYPQAWYTCAVANYNLRRYDEAEQRARQAVKLDPNHVNPRAQYLLGLVLKEKQDYAGAAAELAAYMKYAPHAPDLTQAQDELRQIEKMLGEASQAAK
jgi:tetratricopeptide (TPR) repeat protein